MSIYTVSHGDKPQGMMSPVPTNVQPQQMGLPGAGPGHPDQFGIRGNLTPQRLVNNVRIDSMQTGQPHQVPNSVNTTVGDGRNQQHQLFAPHTVPSNNFAAPQIPGATQPGQPALHPSVPSVPSSLPIQVPSSVSIPVSIPPQPSQTVPSSAVAIAPVPTTTAGDTTTSSVPTTSGAPSTPVPATSSTPAPRTTGAKGTSRGRRGGRASNVNNSNQNASQQEVPITPQQQGTFGSSANGVVTSVAETSTLPSLNSTLIVPPPATPNAVAASPSGQLLPPSEGIYRSFEELLRAIQQMAKEQGYGIVKLRASNYRDQKPTRYDLVCDRGGVKYNSTAKKRNPSTRKVDCPWRAKAVCEVQLNNQWRFQVQDSRHNHEPRIASAFPGMEQTPTSQVLRTISNKLDRVTHDMTAIMERMDTRLESFEKRFDAIEARLSGIDSHMNPMDNQNRMDIPMEDGEMRLLAGSSMMPGQQQPEQGQGPGPGQMPPPFYQGP